MKTFKNLEFKPHRIVPDGIQAYIEFENGTWLSVVAGEGLYGNGDNSFEIMSSSTNRTLRGVKGWLSKKQITSHMRYLQTK